MPSSAWSAPTRDLHSFPTRRSSDLTALIGFTRAIALETARTNITCNAICPGTIPTPNIEGRLEAERAETGQSREEAERAFLATRQPDRKSTRLNSSHGYISYAVFCLVSAHPRSTLFPYTTLFRSDRADRLHPRHRARDGAHQHHLQRHLPRYDPHAQHRRTPGSGEGGDRPVARGGRTRFPRHAPTRSEEHTSELQSRLHIVCRLLPGQRPPEIYTLSLHDALPI